MSGRLDMNEKKLEERKKMIYGLLCDELYVPMRTKEIAMLLDIPKCWMLWSRRAKPRYQKKASTRRQKKW